MDHTENTASSQPTHALMTALGTEHLSSHQSNNGKGAHSTLLLDAFESLKPALAGVENQIDLALESVAPELVEVSRYLLRLGGKRIRPFLVMLTAKLFSDPKVPFEPSEQLITVSAGIELIHMATLLHDDIIDQSLMRRGKASAYRQFGTNATLLAGDFLLTRAFGLCARLDRFVIETTEAACVELTEGENLEGRLSLNREVTLEEYRTIISKKTASLFKLALLVGSHLSLSNEQPSLSSNSSNHESIVATLGEFGERCGVAFQMIDDILDIVANEEILGKPIGTDLKQKTPSLVNILWLKGGSQEAIEFFSDASDGSASVTPSDERIRETISLLKNSDIINQSRARACSEANAADEILTNLTPLISNQLALSQLRAVLHSTLERCL